MTKRFKIDNNIELENKIETYEFSCIVDTETKAFYFIVDDILNVKIFVARLNCINDENERLRTALERKDELLKDVLKVNENLLKKIDEPNCRKCTHFSCDSASAYCMEKDWDSIDEMIDATDCKHYESVL